MFRRLNYVMIIILRCLYAKGKTKALMPQAKEGLGFLFWFNFAPCWSIRVSLFLQIIVTTADAQYLQVYQTLQS